MTKPLDRMDVAVLYIDGIEAADHTAVSRLGVDIDGKKRNRGCGRTPARMSYEKGLSPTWRGGVLRRTGCSFSLL